MSLVLDVQRLFAKSILPSLSLNMVFGEKFTHFVDVLPLFAIRSMCVFPTFTINLWEKNGLAMLGTSSQFPSDPVFPKDLAGTSQTFQLAPGEEPVTAGRYVPWSRASGVVDIDDVDGKMGATFWRGRSNLMLNWLSPKIRGKTPKMDGENNGKPY